MLLELRPGQGRCCLSSLDLGRKEGLVSELSKSPSTKYWCLNWASYKRDFIFFLRQFRWSRSLDFTDEATEIRLGK